MWLKEKVYRALIKYWGSREEVSNSEKVTVLCCSAKQVLVVFGKMQEYPAYSVLH